MRKEDPSLFTRTESFRVYLSRYPAVSALCFIHLVLFLLLLVPAQPLMFLFASLDGYNLGIAEGEWWRLITPIFLHANFSHLFFNTVSLIIFAPPLEVSLKKGKFLLLYVLCGVTANAATFFIEPLEYSHIGASGAIFGLFGVFLYMAFFRKEAISKANSQLVIIILAVGFLTSFLYSQINIAAHVFGFLAGMALAPLFLRRR
ncbi:rhomboid family intramembrane serine protease [Metabacillus sp. GX 13764]|uniref:rhomboid family intramembrane serine protease n=1 Tax=Metabacillus kandeliae TaxID=2900151 RepID=UPI001E500C76|nr:rhomboid family intramembrane serine protease [Metabacillus kandeliae]